MHTAQVPGGWLNCETAGSGSAVVLLHGGAMEQPDVFNQTVLDFLGSVRPLLVPASPAPAPPSPRSAG